MRPAEQAVRPAGALLLGRFASSVSNHAVRGAGQRGQERASQVFDGCEMLAREPSNQVASAPSCLDENAPSVNRVSPTTYEAGSLASID
jgi:hypothetical protein